MTQVLLHPSPALQSLYVIAFGVRRASSTDLGQVPVQCKDKMETSNADLCALSILSSKAWNSRPQSLRVFVSQAIGNFGNI